MTELADDTFFMYPDGTFFMPGHLATTVAATPAASTAAPVPTPADDSDASSDSSDLPALIYLDGDSEVAIGIPVVTATAIGTAVGAFTAALVGTAVGTAAGAAAGTADGAAVGAFGHTVGTAVSAVTGAAVATVVGAAVGTAVGTAAATAAATAADSAADAATDTMGGADAHMPDVVFVQGSAIAHNVFSLAQLAHVLNMITPSRSPGPDGLRAADVRTYPPSPPPPSPPPPPPPPPLPPPPSPAAALAAAAIALSAATATAKGAGLANLVAALLQLGARVANLVYDHFIYLGLLNLLFGQLQAKPLRHLSQVSEYK